MTYESPSTEEARRASELHRPTTRWRISSPLQRATHTYGMAADTFGMALMEAEKSCWANCWEWVFRALLFCEGVRENPASPNYLETSSTYLC